MVCSGNEKLHKCLRTFSHKTGYTNILESLEAQSHSSPGEEHGSFDISVKDGGYPEFKTSRINKRNMGSSSPMWDRSYCRVPSQQTERDSRSGVKKQFRLLGMETSSPVISENLSTEENSRDRSICFQIISSDQDLLFVEDRSIEPSSRCLPKNWFHKSLYVFRPYCMIPKILSKVRKEKEPMMILVTPAWPSQMWYPEAMRMSIQQPILLTWRRDLLKNPQGEIPPLVQNKTLKLVAWTVSGLDYKRKEFQGGLPTLSLNQEDQVLTQIMNRPGVNGLAGVLKGKLIHFVVI